MFSYEITYIIHWWFVLFLLGIGFLPLTSLLFKNFFDKGYIFSKLLGLALTGYTVFILGIAHIAPFSQGIAYGIFFMLAALSFLFLPKKDIILLSLTKRWKVYAYEEALFFIALFTWAYIHGFAPDIHGLEKYMDFGFINSFLRSDYFPPKDMWFTPFSINYYYFGHLLTALLIKLSGVPPEIGFNVMLSTIFAFCMAQSFSLGANLYALMHEKIKISKIKLILAGFLTMMLTSLAGNLHIIYAFFKQYPNDGPVPFWELPFLPTTFPNAYWYPNATRFIYHTIHEFPIYSWVVADLHGHVLDIPFVLFIIALLFSIFINNTNKEIKKTPQFFQIHPAILIILGLILSIMYMTNAWDGAIYLLLAGFIIYHVSHEAIGAYKREFKQKWFITWGRNTLASFLIVVFSFALFAFPYSYHFKPFVSGIGVLCAPKILTDKGRIGPLLFEADHCQHSYWWELLMLYGFFYFFIISFSIFTSRIKKLLPTDIFALLLIILSTILIILPEFIYVKDIYPAHYRANTMFKLVFQAFIMLSIASGYIIVRIIANIKNQKSKIFNLSSIFILITFVLLMLVMTYPYLAIKSYYSLTTYKGLDGMKYLQTLYQTDYDAIVWLNQNVKGQPVILEAQGDSYTDYARVSSNTGLPTVLGWTVHEWLWRGSYDIPSPRINEIKTMYETEDLNTAREYLKKYKVEYVFIGALERQKHPQLNEAKFSKLGTVVFNKGTTKIYRIEK
jgi:uncharacterized membrane protein